MAKQIFKKLLDYSNDIFTVIIFLSVIFLCLCMSKLESDVETKLNLLNTREKKKKIKEKS